MPIRTATWTDILPGALLLHDPGDPDALHLEGPCRITVTEVDQVTGKFEGDGVSDKHPSLRWYGKRKHVDAGKYQLVEPAPEARPERF